MFSIFDDLRRQWESGDRVVQLIFVNLAVFLAFALLYVVFFVLNTTDMSLYSAVERYFAASNSLEFTLWHPWTPLTYQFMHSGLSHIFWNMLMLYWFGGIVQDLLGRRVMIPLYLLGGFGGYVAFVLASILLPSVVPPNAMLVGASGAVVATILAAAVTSPDYELRFILIGEVKIKYIAAISLLIYVLSIPYGNAGGHFAHLGGAFVGWQFVYQMRRGNDMAGILNDFWQKIRGVFDKKTDKKRGSSTSTRPKTPRSVFEEPHNISGDESATQKMTDAILEKIKRSGYQSLTDKEREWLHKISKQ